MGTATVPLCQYSMDNATRCGSPAMRGTRYCYSHDREQARRARKNAERARQRWFESVPLDDAASVQRALMQVMSRLVSGKIDHKQAGQILYKLQTASTNLRSADANLEADRLSGCGGAGPADAGSADLVSDPGAGAGRAADYQSLSVWVQEGW
jgi:hypothetical protein